MYTAPKTPYTPVYPDFAFEIPGDDEDSLENVYLDRILNADDAEIERAVCNVDDMLCFDLPTDFVRMEQLPDNGLDILDGFTLEDADGHYIEMYLIRDEENLFTEISLSELFESRTLENNGIEYIVGNAEWDVMVEYTAGNGVPYWIALFVGDRECASCPQIQAYLHCLTTSLRPIAE